MAVSSCMQICGCFNASELESVKFSIAFLKFEQMDPRSSYLISCDKILMVMANVLEFHVHQLPELSCILSVFPIKKTPLRKSTFPVQAPL